MTTPINLNKVRKTHDLAMKKAQADVNATRFGRTKAERLLDVARTQQDKTRLDQQKFEDE